MTTATVTMHVGDVRDIQADLPDNGFDLLVTSPPFLALRSYLPADHPDKHRELGSEPTPAAFLDTLYGLTADWGRLLPEWASICVELGDTMSGSGGAGGDYNADGLRDGQERFSQKRNKYGDRGRTERGSGPNGGGAYDAFKGGGPGGPGWPLAKSMCLTPHLYTIGLAYGHNPLTGTATPAGQWRIRNVITWARPNPPVGSLGRRNPHKRTGDYKFRPACSYITVACRGTGRYFDLDAVRNGIQTKPGGTTTIGDRGSHDEAKRNRIANTGSDPAGAPPLDWHQDGIEGDGLFTLEQHQLPPHRRTVIRRNDPRRPLLSYITVACRGTGRYFDLDAVRGEEPRTLHNDGATPKHLVMPEHRSSNGAPFPNHHNFDHHARGGAPPLDWHTDQLDGDWLWKLATAPYPGAHYATYPLTLPRRLVLAMCPSEVCRTCGWPRERVVGEATYVNARTRTPVDKAKWQRDDFICHQGAIGRDNGSLREAPTLGFTDCGHDNYRPGHVLDPFAGSGTTAVAAALEQRDCTLIDLDPRNVDLTHRRLADVCRIHDRTTNGDTTTWTVEPSSAKVLAAIAEGQLELW